MHPDEYVAAPGGARFDVPLDHNHVVVFSLDTNRRFTHKIVPHLAAPANDNEWLGVTFRTSGTWVRVDGDTAVFEDGTPLTLADEDERAEFYRLRGRENREPGFTYPTLSYTISPSDRMPPTAG